MTTATEAAPANPNVRTIDGRQIYRRVTIREGSLDLAVFTELVTKPKPGSWNDGSKDWDPNYTEPRPVATLGDEHDSFGRWSRDIAAQPLPEADHADPVKMEVAKLQGMGLPLLAGVLAKAHRHSPAGPPTGLFSAGPVRYSKKLSAVGVHPADVRELVSRFVSGDLGEYGSMIGVEVSESDRFCPPLASRAARAVMAAEKGRGLVHGRFPMGPDPREGRQGEAVSVEITTLLNGMTLVTLGDVEGHPS